MRGRTILIALAIVGAGTASTAPATAAPKYSTMPDRMANCLYERWPARAQGVLSAASLPDADRHYTKLLDERSCFDDVIGDKEFTPEEYVLPLHLMRGFLAEQALRKVRDQAKTLPALPLQKQYARPWYAATNRNTAINEMATCVADTDPAGILALLETSPGDFAEGAAIATLKPSLSRCLSANTRMESDTRPVRAALAEALYQRVQNPTLSLAQASETPR